MEKSVFSRMFRVALAVVCLVAALTLVGSVQSARADDGKTESGAQSYAVLPVQTVAECVGCVAQPSVVQLAGVPLRFAAPIGGWYGTPVNFGGLYGAYLNVSAPTSVWAYGKPLVFKHWRSVTDNKILSANPTLVGYINKGETLAAVYQAPAPAQPVTVSVKGECENCTFNVGVAGLSVPLSTQQGVKTTPTQLTQPANSQLVLAAPAYVNVQGHLLQFRAWRSVTDNRVVSTSPALAGLADKTETLAVVYREVPMFKGWETAPLDQ